MQSTVQWLELLLKSGMMLAKFFSSPLGSPFGVAVPVVSGLQALVDRASGKVNSKRLPDTNDPAMDRRREGLRKRIYQLWRAQLAIAIFSGVLDFWLYVVDDIPKVGTPPIATPSALQSLALIVLMILTVVAIVLMLARASTTFGLDKLN